MRLFAAAALVSLVPGREEFVHGEAHFAEQVTGVVGGGTALLAGQAVVVHRDQHLYVAYQLYDGEDTHGDIDDALAVVGEVSTVGRADVFGNVPTATTAAAALVLAFFRQTAV